MSLLYSIYKTIKYNSRSFGSVYSWGRGQFGSLGHGNYMPYTDPKIINALKEENIVKVACGWANSAAIDKEGKLYVWGFDLDRQACFRLANRYDQIPQFIQKIQHLKWPSFLHEELKFLVYQTGTCLPTTPENISDVRFVDVAVGASSYIAVTDTGEAYAWGMNDKGQCGVNDKVKTVVMPRMVTEINNSRRTSKFIKCAAGFLHTMLLDEMGVVYVCGHGERGRLGLNFSQMSESFGLEIKSFVPINEPVAASKNESSSLMEEMVRSRAISANLSLGPVSQISAGFCHSVFLSNGDVYICGRGNTGILGLKTEEGLDVLSDVSIPTKVHLPEKIKQVSCGEHHTVALGISGTVYTWGLNRFGECGRAAHEFTKRNVTNVSAPNSNCYEIQYMNPGKITLPENFQVKSICAGFYQTAVITNDDVCYIFGPSTHEPMRVLPGKSVQDISLGWKHSIAVVKS